MRSIFAARQRYMRGLMTKAEFNQLVAREIFAKWVPIAQDWRWLAEVSAYLELKHLGAE